MFAILDKIMELWEGCAGYKVKLYIFIDKINTILYTLTIKIFERQIV